MTMPGGGCTSFRDISNNRNIASKFDAYIGLNFVHMYYLSIIYYAPHFNLIVVSEKHWPQDHKQHFLMRHSVKGVDRTENSVNTILGCGLKQVNSTLRTLGHPSHPIQLLINYNATNLMTINICNLSSKNNNI